MAYFRPYIDEAGFHVPTYTDTRDHLVEEAKNIYGQDIYLENDSQDYQMISLMADKIHDTYLVAQMVYNNRGPGSAILGALDGLVQLNGLRRKPATKSTCKVILLGEPGTEIVNGIIAHDKNINWDLETPITIPEFGQLEVLATCQRYGAIHAGAGQLNRIVTPTYGWRSVTNPEAAVIGQEVETQEALRARQSVSTAKPSKTVLEGTIGGIAEIPDVTRYRVYENDTNVEDENTVPGHHICAVVEGGQTEEIAQEIYRRKTPGCGTYGDIVVEMDERIIHGMKKAVPIRFFRPRYIDVFVTVTLKAFPGYLSKMTEDIKVNIAAYLNRLQIGENLTLSALWYVTFQATPTSTMPLFSILDLAAGTDAEHQGREDIPIPFHAVTRGRPEQIQVNFTV